MATSSISIFFQQTVSTRGQLSGKEGIADNRRQFYVNLDGESLSKMTEPHNGFRPYSSLPTNGILPELASIGGYRRGTSISSHGTNVIKCPYGDCTFEDFDTENDPVFETTTSTTLSHQNVYETLDRLQQQTYSTDTIDNSYKTFDSISEITRDNNSEIVKVDCHTCGSSRDHIYETLSLRGKRNSILHPVDDFSASGKLIETPMSSHGVRKWEYQATLNRLKYIKLIPHSTVQLQENN